MEKTAASLSRLKNACGAATLRFSEVPFRPEVFCECEASCVSRRYSRGTLCHSVWLCVFLAFGVFTVGLKAQSAQAQVAQTKQMSRTGQVPQDRVEQMLQKKGAVSAREVLQKHHEKTSAPMRREEGKRPSFQGAAPVGQILSGRPITKVASSNLSILEEQARLYGSPWPREDLNFMPRGNDIQAGDVNGDGSDDWIYRRTGVADPRTSELSDRTPKTFLAFGGRGFSARYYDELYYRELRPIGNFIGGDGTDAFRSLDGGGFQVFLGTSTGYKETQTILPDSLPGTDPSPGDLSPVDLDGDGYTELIEFSLSSSRTEFEIAFGGQDPSDVEVRSFSVPADPDRRPLFSFATGDIDGDGAGEIIRFQQESFSGGPSSPLLTVIEASGRDSLTVRQSTGVNLLDFPFSPQIANIDGSGLKEIFARLSSESVIQANDGIYEKQVEFYPGSSPVGDLNGDGRADFVLRDTSDQTPYIAFGPASVSDGLSFDLQIPTGPSGAVIEGFGVREPTDDYGSGRDLDGDGRGELIAQYDGEDRFGVRLLGVSSDGASVETEDFLFDRSSYRGRKGGVDQTFNAGDWNGDGSEDVGFLLNDGRVEIYFGDPAEASSPDVTLTGPPYGVSDDINGTVATGDFTGDGNQNLAVAWESDTETVQVYEAGQGDNPIHTIGIEDLGIPSDAEGIADQTIRGEFFENSPNSVVANLGDINGDGIEDFGITQPEVDTDQSKKAFLYFGGTSLPARPDATAEFNQAVTNNVGQVLRGIGDVNGDGTDDFLVGDTFGRFSSGPIFPEDPTGEGFSGALFVFFGEASRAPTFDTPDLALTVPTREQTADGLRTNGNFGWGGVAVGDFNGDDTTDVAATPFSSRDSEGDGSQAVRVFYGGEKFGSAPDAELPVPGFLSTGSRLAEGHFGALTVVPTATSGPDRLMLERFFGTGALIYGPGTDASSALEKQAFLSAPDQRGGLGVGSTFINFPQSASSAAGDFDGDTRSELILPQPRSADFRGKPAYAYQLGTGQRVEPVPSVSITQPVDSNSSAVEFGGTGTSVVFSDETEGLGEVTVERFDSRPEGGSTIETENVSEYRARITTSGNLSVGDSTEVRFDTSMLDGISRPSQVTIYAREPSGLGVFQEVSTTYDASKGELVGLVSGFSEFAFGSDTEPLFSYPEALSVEASRAFPGASGPGDRLVALPGQVDTPLAQTFSGEAGADWQAYWDDGSAESPFLRYEESETFDFRPGRGFWVTSRQDWSFSDSLSTVPLGAGQATAVPLNGDSTWTIVSNPLDRDAAWRSVRAENDITAPLWRFDGSEGFVRADTMASAASGEAYYFFNGAGLDSLRVPYPATGTRSGAGSKSATAAGTVSAPLALSAAPAGTDDPPSTIHVGLSEQERSALAPPGRFEPASLRIVGLEKEKSSSPRASGYMVKARPAGTEGGHTFQLRLESQPGEPVRLSTSGLEALEGRSASLIVPSMGKSYDLRPGRTVEVEPEGGATRLRLAVGTSQYVGEEARSALPEEMSLTSYPNPTGGQATVEYALPEARKVTLEVYDVLGRRVATLADGKKQAGRHEASLQAGDLPSGVYFGRLEAGGETRTQKITVVR
jgi:hypothetical protein